MLSINTNLSSLIAQSSMKTSTNKLNQAIERMTTGFKINHASDNAANYSISTNMTTKIGAYNVAEDNAAMGLDMISTAEGTLNQIQDKLERLRALQEQASNGTYGEQSLNAINTEANALVDEIERLYSTAEYNGLKLFGIDTTERTPQTTTFSLMRTVNESNTFIQEVVRRDTSDMIKLEDVEASSVLAQGTYSISTADGLAKLATMQNQGLLTDGSEFVLADNIDLSAYSAGEGWTPIGQTGGLSFKSTFDGNGYVVSNLTINATSNGLDLGLFGKIGKASIKNLGVENANVSTTSGSGAAGVLIGWCDGANITNCYATGSVSGAYRTGGLIGSLDSDNANVNISYCWADVDVNSVMHAGGLLCGGPEVIELVLISNCYSLGNVHSENTSNVTIPIAAGFAAGTTNSSVSMTNCYSSGVVTTTTDLALSGFATSSSVNLTNCYWDTESSGVTNDVGGATGVTTAELNNLIASGSLPSNSGLSGGNSGGASTDSPLPPSFTPAPNTIVLQIGASSNWASQVGVSTVFELEGVDELRNIGLDLAMDYLGQIDDMLALVSEKQTQFGAVSNRLESVLEEIIIQRDNLISSRSTIRDADIAEVSASYIQQQILQEASATLLATANQSPSIALQLI